MRTLRFRSCWTSRNCSVFFTKRAREALNVQRETARRALLHQQGGFLAATNQYGWLRGKILSVLWQETVKRTFRTCRCMFDGLNVKQMRDFPNGRGNCYLDFLRKPIELLKINEKFCNGSNTRSLDEMSYFTTYYSARNQFERFREFLVLITRFEFEFCRPGNYFFERFEFLVCSKFNHKQCGRTCACAGPVCAHRIPIRMLWCP